MNKWTLIVQSMLTGFLINSVAMRLFGVIPPDDIAFPIVLLFLSFLGLGYTTCSMTHKGETPSPNSIDKDCSL